jgi:hypothetical protein
MKTNHTRLCFGLCVALLADESCLQSADSSVMTLRVDSPAFVLSPATIIPQMMKLLGNRNEKPK